MAHTDAFHSAGHLVVGGGGAAFSALRPLIEVMPVNASPTSADVAASSRWTACDCGPRRPVNRTDTTRVRTVGFRLTSQVQAAGMPHQPGADVPLDQESQALRPPPA
jgi:hypothetical protein